MSVWYISKYICLKYRLRDEISGHGGLVSLALLDTACLVVPLLPTATFIAL